MGCKQRSIRTSQFQENGIRLEAQLVELVSKNPKVDWLLDVYYSAEKHANTALEYVLKHGEQCGYILPRTVKLETQLIGFMNASAARDSIGMPLIYVNRGLRFFLAMLNYSLVWAAFNNTVSGGRIMSATLFTIMNGYWPPEVDLLFETEAMGGLSEDERYFITAWIPSQMFFLIAHEFAYHLIWHNQQESPQVHNLRLLTGREIEICCPLQRDELRADRIAFDIWNKLDATLSDGFQAFTAGGLGALFGYFRIQEEYTKFISSNPQLPAVYRYERLKTWLASTGRVHSLQAMEETWSMAEAIMKACLQAKGMLHTEDVKEGTPPSAKGNDVPNECA